MSLREGRDVRREPIKKEITQFVNAIEANTLVTTGYDMQQDSNKNIKEEPFVIDSKERYFGRYIFHTCQVNGERGHKICYSKKLNTITVAGPDDLIVLKANGSSWDSNCRQTAYTVPSVSAISKEEEIILQNPISNNFTVYDQNMNEVKIIVGNTESGKIPHHFHESRCSLDKNFALWRKGQESIALVRMQDYSIFAEITDFWNYFGQKSMPVCAVHSGDGDKIAASSMAGPDSHIFHFFKQGQESIAKPCKDVARSLERITSMDVSGDGKTIYLAGVSNSRADKGKSSILAANFDEDLLEIECFVFDHFDCGKIRRVYRIQGSEILLLGCNRHIVVLDFEGARFKFLSTLRNLHQYDVCDILFIKEHKIIASKGFREKHVKLTVMDQDIPQDDSSVTKSILKRGSQVKKNNSSEKETISTFPGLKLEKITLSKDGSSIFAGGKGVQIFRNDGDGQYKLSSTVPAERIIFY